MLNRVGIISKMKRILLSCFVLFCFQLGLVGEFTSLVINFELKMQKKKKTIRIKFNDEQQVFSKKKNYFHFAREPKK